MSLVRWLRNRAQGRQRWPLVLLGMGVGLGLAIGVEALRIRRRVATPF